MRKTLVCLSLVALLGVSGQAIAAIGTIDAVPAATLLLPYFEVDLADPNGITTLFSINNASAAAAIAHVTLWTDLSIPTLDFNVFLTGFDVHTINLRDIFHGTGSAGVFPVSRADNAATGPGGSSSAGRRGPWSFSTPQTQLVKPFNPTSPFGNCFDQLPLPNLPDPWYTHIRNAHRGLGSTFFGGQCSAVNHGDNIVRGYITIDNVSYCSLDFPEDVTYWTGATRAPINVNQLWGDYYYVNPGENFAQGMTLVHIEANDELGFADEYTFYRRYSNLHGVSDNREGLGSSFATRYLTAGLISGETTLQVWRDSKRGNGRVAGTGIPTFNCGANPPSPYPLGQHQVVIFDEEENPDVFIPVCPVSPCIDIPESTPFPWEAQRVRVGSSVLPTPFAFGWIYLNLNTLVAGQTVGDIHDPDAMQNWVTMVATAGGRFSVGHEAIQLDNVTFPFTHMDISLPVPFPIP
jgi:hypothetical protein